MKNLNHMISKFNEKYIQTSKGLTIFTESIGDSNNPPVILIMGALNQGIFWYDSFCKYLSDNDLFVIRFDHRDTGFSSIINYKESQYNLNDLTDDVVDILNSYDVKKAHIVGLSMGGYIGQLLGINYPEKVETLTLISTTADHRPYMDGTMGNLEKKYLLPYPEKVFLDYIEKSKINSPKNDIEIKNNQIEGWKVIFSNISNEDFNEIMKLIEVSNKRSKDKYSQYNHGLAVFNSKERTDLLKNIIAPTFIFHGEKDPCFPLDHGKLLHKLIPGSKLEIIKGMGHMFSLSESKHLAEKIVKNI